MALNDLSHVSVDAGIFRSIISEHSNQLGKDICSCNCVSACWARLHNPMPALSLDWTTRLKPLGKVINLVFIPLAFIHLFTVSMRSSNGSWSMSDKATGHTVSDKVKLPDRSSMRTSLSP